MTNEEIVLKRLERIAKSPIYFKGPEKTQYDYYWRNSADNNSMYKRAKESYDSRIKTLKSANSVYDRVYNILKICQEYSSVYGNNKLQCHSGANRSAQDIWRIYKFYFGDIDIFSIMRALYKLAVEDRILNGYRCPAVRKQVFWLATHGGELETHNKADLGVPVSEWKNIGL